MIFPIHLTSFSSWHYCSCPIFNLILTFSLAYLLTYSLGSIEDSLKTPLKEALEQYRDGPGNDEAQEAYKKVWNQVQKEVSPTQNLNYSSTSIFWSDLSISSWSVVVWRMCETGQTAQNVDSSQEQTSRWAVVVSPLKRRIQRDRVFLARCQKAAAGGRRWKERGKRQTQPAWMSVEKKHCLAKKYLRRTYWAFWYLMQACRKADIPSGTPWDTDYK